MSTEIKKTEEEQKEEILNELKENWKIEEEVSFNEFNIQEKLQNNAFILIKYQKQLDREKFNLEKMTELKEKIVGEQYHFYRFNQDETLTKPEIEKYYLPRDKKIIQINKLIRLQEVKVKFFEICCKALDKMRLKHEKLYRSQQIILKIEKTKWFEQVISEIKMLLILFL